MRSFVILFQEKEGTSAIVSLLANARGVHVVHQADGTYEPFDRHACTMPTRELGRCLDQVLGPDPVDMDALNRTYRWHAQRPLDDITKPAAVGFKMRYRPSHAPWLLRRVPSRWRADATFLHTRWQTTRGAYRRTLFDVLRRNDVVVFVAARQDVLRWALSCYHGDGTGRAGHLQFRLASGELSRDEIPKIQVDVDRFAAEVARRERSHARKAAALADLRASGIDAHPMLYERFTDEPETFFAEVLERIEVDASAAAVRAMLEQGARFEKVHSPDIADFVSNHEEVLERFGDRYVDWTALERVTPG